MSHSTDGTWEKLSQVALKGAAYDSRERQPHPKCLEGTRVDLLNYIYELSDKREKSQLIWLHGTAGVGKSAVAFTVAERMRSLKATKETNVEKRLGGTFFFSRTNTNRRTTAYFFATLAYQLASNFTVIRKDVNHAIRENPAILDPDSSLRDQMEALFLQPLRKLHGRLDGCPPLSFIVDALDECTSETELADLISLLGRALREPDLPMLHILLTSRSEVHIREAMQEDAVHPLVCEIPVKTSGDGIAAIISLDGADVDNDICIFLEHSFRKLRGRYPDFPQLTRDQLVQLASRAGRRFIVASTMMKFINDGYNDPRGRLQIMLQLTSELLPGTEVYKLYDSILSTCADPNRAYMHLSIVVALADPLPISQISKLLGPGEGRDVETTLVQLRSIMDIPTDINLPVTIYHASVRDYVSHPSNCSLPDIRRVTPHTLLAYSSFCLMMQDIPGSTTLLDALAELSEHREVMQSDDPQNLKQSLAFIVQLPEPLQVLTSLLWLRGDHSSVLQCWLETLDGHSWLETLDGRSWLYTQAKYVLEIQREENRLQALGEEYWLQTFGGKMWLQTKSGRDWLHTPDGRDWLHTQGGHTQDGQHWLQTQDGRSWLQTQGGRGWLPTPGGRGWLQTQGGRSWLQTQDGRGWMPTPGGCGWLQTPGGRGWLQIQDGRRWLQTRDGQLWLKTRDGRSWLQTEDGRSWLQTEEGEDWLQTEEGEGWLRTEDGCDWLQTKQGREWLRTKDGRDWLRTKGGYDWLQTEDGRDWPNVWGNWVPSPGVMTINRRSQRRRGTEKELWAPGGYDRVQTPHIQTLETPDVQAWLRTQSGQAWMQTVGVKDLLQTQSGRDWLQSLQWKDWLQPGSGQNWLQTLDGQAWLLSPGGETWLHTSEGQAWLRTYGGGDWLQTQSGKDWLQTQKGQEWLQTQSGQDWLQTPHGQAWPLLPVWVVMEDFSSTLEAVDTHTIIPELSLLPAFQVIQHFKSLPDFLMFPVFLALRHQDASTFALPQGRFPDMKIMHAMKAFVNFASEPRERSRSASDALKYACQNWVVHLSRAPNPWDPTINHIFESFWNRNLLSWLEMQWCLKGLRSCLAILSEGAKLATKHLKPQA